MNDDEEKESENTYTTLQNVFQDSSFEFEDFLDGNRSDDERDVENESNDVSNNQDDEDEFEDDEDFEEDTISTIEENLNNIEVTASEGCSLTSAETAIIQSCTNPELRKLLLLNRSKHFMLMQLFIKIRDQLIECRKKIKGVVTLSVKTEKPVVQLLSHLAAPYFKTKRDMFSSSPNEDTIAKNRNGELSIHQNCMAPKWSHNQGDNLISAVKLTYNHNRQKEILRRISSLRFKLNKEKGDSTAALQIIVQIDRLEEELKDIKALGMNDIPPLGKDDFIDWNHIASEYLKDKHNAQECRSFWHIYLHPSINKSNWTAEENINIKKLALKYQTQDWDRIALELGSQRSGFSVFLHYQSALSEQFSRHRFTQEEDNLILEQVEKLRIGSYIPWSAIESYFPNRSRNQLVHRYKYFISNGDVEFGAFTDAEDILLLILVERYGKNYSKFWNLIPNRSYMQVKNRYDLQLQAFTTSARFSVEDDQMIMDYMAGPSGVKYIGDLAREMNRKRCQLRQRYNTLKAFFERNPKASLKDAPRRALLANDKANKRLEFLKYIAEQFKNNNDLPTISEIQEKLGRKTTKNTRKSNEYYDVDALLVNFFSNSYKLRRQNNIDTTSHKIRDAADTISQVLLKWKVNLKIPDELKKNNHLDVVDVEILNSLREKHKNCEFNDTNTINDLIPPNINTIVGLRSLLLRNQVYKKIKNKPQLGLMDDLPLIRNKFDYDLSSELINMQKGMNPNTLDKIEEERCVFLDRFVSLFMWPAIFSIEPPGKRLLDAEFGVPTEEKQEKSIKRKKVKNCTSPKKYEPKVKRKKLCTETPESEQNPTRASLRPRRSTRLKNIPVEIQPEEAKPKLDEKTVIKPVAKIIKIVKLPNVTEQGTDSEIGELPPNLRKVDKSEVEKMLKNKKPIKMFLIQKIKMKDGTVKTITKPYVAPQPSTSQTADEKLTKVNILDVVSKVTSVKKEGENAHRKEYESGSLGDMEQVLKNNIKQYSERISSKLSSGKNLTNEEKDVCKLDDFLNNHELERDSVQIDLTEGDIMKNEVELLEKLIKSESGC